MTHTPNTHGAYLKRSFYHDGYGRREFARPFYVVHCDDCSIMLNSAHHYPEDGGLPSVHACSIAVEHNKSHHPEMVAS